MVIVWDNDWVPVVGASVQLDGIGYGETDVNGELEIKDLSAGFHYVDVVVTKDGIDYYGYIDFYVWDEYWIWVEGWLDELDGDGEFNDALIIVWDNDWEPVSDATVMLDGIHVDQDQS